MIRKLFFSASGEADFIGKTDSRGFNHGSTRINSRFKKAQSSIEVTLAFICVAILLLSTVKIFIWFAERITRRQEDYEATRAAAGSIAPDQPGVYVDESNYPKLDIFSESN